MTHAFFVVEGSFSVEVTVDEHNQVISGLAKEPLDDEDGDDDDEPGNLDEEVAEEPVVYDQHGLPIDVAKRGKPSVMKEH